MKKKNEKWVVAAKKADFNSIAERFSIDPVIARIIRNRDIIGDEAMEEYLHGTLRSLHDPRLMKGCLEAALLIKQKIEQKKKIRIIGDYDIDGVNSTYILYTGICRCGGISDFEIPNRMKDGYGLNINLIHLAEEEDVDTIITCDNGISALDEIRYARAKGMTVIVTDHHEPLYEESAEAEGFETSRTYKLPEADVLINPRQPGCMYPFKKLCGAAVAWKLICELYSIFQIPQSEAEKLIQFAAFATVGDVMDLQGENRIIVKAGLNYIRNTDNYGLKALIHANNLQAADICAYHIGFVLGPCINASGRLDTAKHSLRLLLAKTEEEAMECAGILKTLNDERKELTTEAVEKACALIDHGELKEDHVLVVYLPDCHESIAGIVAGRLRERYYRPVFVVTNAEGCAKGSARSIEGYSMFDEMVKCSDLFLKFGGHPMAAGFSLESSRIKEMRHRLNENCLLTEQQLMEKITIDVPMPLDYITEELVGELEQLEPFGKGNEKPLFAEAGLTVINARVIGKNANVLKMRVINKSGKVMDALWFGDPEELRQAFIEKYGEKAVLELYWGSGTGLKMDFVYYPAVNEYMGRKTIQIIIKNYR